jgi:hypothetical protein
MMDITILDISFPVQIIESAPHPKYHRYEYLNYHKPQCENPAPDADHCDIPEPSHSKVQTVVEIDALDSFLGSESQPIFSFGRDVAEFRAAEPQEKIFNGFCWLGRDSLLGQ